MILEKTDEWLQEAEGLGVGGLVPKTTGEIFRETKMLCILKVVMVVT